MAEQRVNFSFDDAVFVIDTDIGGLRFHWQSLQDTSDFSEANERLRDLKGRAENIKRVLDRIIDEAENCHKEKVDACWGMAEKQSVWQSAGFIP